MAKYLRFGFGVLVRKRCADSGARWAVSAELREAIKGCCGESLREWDIRNMTELEQWMFLTAFSAIEVWITIAGAKLFFDVEGAKLAPRGDRMLEKPTLLTLHGGPGHDHAQLRSFWSQFADVAQVIFLDQRGNGRSDWTTPKDWTLDRWADDIHDFCVALKIEKPIVMGVSFGASVAMNYASRHPDNPGKLILISATGRRRIDRMLAVYERLGGPAAREAARRWNENAGVETAADFVRLCYPLYFRTKQRTVETVKGISNRNLVLWWECGTERFRDLLPELSRVTCPALVMGGEDDPQTPIDDQSDIVAALSNAPVRFERFVECGHGVFPDQPERCALIIREFVATPGG